MASVALYGSLDQYAFRNNAPDVFCTGSSTHTKQMLTPCSSYSPIQRLTSGALVYELDAIDLNGIHFIATYNVHFISDREKALLGNQH